MGKEREMGRASFDPTHLVSYENSMGPLAGRTHRPTRRPLVQTPSARLWERRPNGSPLRVGFGCVGLVLEDELETEHFGEEDEALQRQTLWMRLDRGQSALAHGKPGGQVLLGNSTCFSAPEKDLAYLAGSGDELSHLIYLPEE